MDKILVCQQVLRGDFVFVANGGCRYRKSPLKGSGLDTIRHDGYNENRKRHCDKRLTLFKD